MKVSKDERKKKGKTVAVASSSVMGRAIVHQMRRRGVGVQEKVKNLGVDFAAGGKRKKGRNITLAARYKEAKRKQQRATRLGRKLAPSINRSAIVTSVTYGVASNGATEEQMRITRRMAASGLACRPPEPSCVAKCGCCTLG